MTHAAAPLADTQQLALGLPERPGSVPVNAPPRRRPDGPRREGAPLCAGCRSREARYGFRNEHDPMAERPRTLCFECFRIELGYRQAVAERLARGWNAEQVRLPLQEKLDDLARRRRRAQIAARHALGVR